MRVQIQSDQQRGDILTATPRDRDHGDPDRVDCPERRLVRTARHLRPVWG